MKFEVVREAFVDVLKHAAKIAKTKGTLPQLSDVALSASRESDELQVGATNLEVHFYAGLEADVDVGGQVTVDAARLLAFAKAAPGEKLACELLSSGRMRFVSGSSRVLLAVRPYSEFPQLPDIDTPDTCVVDAVALGGALTRSLYAAALPTSRRTNLAGVYVEGGKFTATDGRRLACAAGPAVLRGASGIWPNGLASAVAGVLKNAAAGTEATVMGDGDWLGVEVGQTFVLGRMVAEAFPDYRTIIPPEGGETSWVVTVAHDDLLGALKRLKSLGDGAAVIEGPIMAPVTLKTRTEISEGVEELVGAPVVGAGVRGPVAFETGLLLDVVNVVGGPDVALDLADPIRPLVVRDGDDVHVVMPMRVPEA